MRAALWFSIGWLLLALPNLAQGVKPDRDGVARPEPALFPGRAPAPHRFWDRTQYGLLAGVGGARALDYLSTLNMRRRGRQEILLTNEVVDNHPAFAAIETAGTGLSIGTAYLFHRYRHHKLERWTSGIHIALAASGAVRNFSLKSAHPLPAP